MEINDIRLKKLAAGASTKDGKRLKKQTQRKKKTMHTLLEELYIWKFLEPVKPGTTNVKIDDFRLDEASVKHMLKSGQPPWGGHSASTAEYWGRLAHRCKNDLARCNEELPDLHIQRTRLKLWLQDVIMKIKKIVVIPGSVEVSVTGRSILLCQKLNQMEALLKELVALKWLLFKIHILFCVSMSSL